MAHEPDTDVLLSALGRIYIVTDPELRVLTFSAALPGLVRRASDELRGSPLQELLGEELTDPAGVIREVARTGRRREGLRAFLREGGGERSPVSLTVGVLDAATAGPTGGRVVLMLRPEPGEEAPVPSVAGIVARSASMQRIFRLFELLRDHDATVLVTGESGTGKELVARALHDTSHRSSRPFIAVNCAALPAELLESELFGHVRGAFTGAVRDRVGRFELADGGTLFLDEVGSMSLPLQAKILRALQEHEFERVGDARTRKVDVRIIAATNENLARAVAQGRFREDLYYRLRVVPIEIPPLRERRDDIEPVTRHLLHRIGASRGRALRLSPSAMDALMRYAWPGNVRELENALEFATTVCEGQTIHVEHLPVEVRAMARGDVPGGSESLGMASAPHTSRAGAEGRAAPEGAWSAGPTPAEAGQAHGPVAAGSPPPADAPFRPGLTPAEAAEARDILEALRRTRFRRQDAAEALGMSRTTLWRKMKQYGI